MEKIILLLLLLLLILIFFYRSNSLSYASITSNYIHPKVYHNLLTKEEADYIIKTASDKFQTSKTIGGLSLDIRKSENAWLSKSDPVVKTIYERLASQFSFDIDSTESLQVVKYQPGGYYREHHDSCCDDKQECKDFIKRGGQRKLTILIYLNDDFEDGSTKFPTLNLDVKPPVYGGVVFHPLEKDGNKCHPYGLHTGTPVKSGIKYVCNIWVREKKFE